MVMSESCGSCAFEMVCGGSLEGLTVQCYRSGKRLGVRLTKAGLLIAGLEYQFNWIKKYLRDSKNVPLG